MEKCYKKFYEVGNNVYYTVNFNGVNYIGIESLLLGKSPVFKKNKKITVGFKLLEVSPCIGILFQDAYASKPTDVDEEFPDMTKYEIPNEEDVTKNIKDTYEGVVSNEIENLEKWYKEQLEENKEDTSQITEYYNKTKEELLNVDMFKGMSIDFKEAEERCPILTSLRENGLKFLYLQEYTSLYDVVYMYEIDVFGTVTIYRIDIVKGKIKGMDSFMVNKAIINAYYEDLYNNK